jgi:hypothetical protein
MAIFNFKYVINPASGFTGVHSQRFGFFQNRNLEQYMSAEIRQPALPAAFADAEATKSNEQTDVEQEDLCWTPALGYRFTPRGVIPVITQPTVVHEPLPSIISSDEDRDSESDSDTSTKSDLEPHAIPIQPPQPSHQITSAPKPARAKVDIDSRGAYTKRPSDFPVHLFRVSVSNEMPSLSQIIPVRDTVRRFTQSDTLEEDTVAAQSPRWSRAGPFQFTDRPSKSIADGCMSPRRQANQVRRSDTINEHHSSSSPHNVQGELLDSDVSLNIMKRNAMSRLIVNDRVRNRFDSFSDKELPRSSPVTLPTISAAVPKSASPRHSPGPSPKYIGQTTPRAPRAANPQSQFSDLKTRRALESKFNCAVKSNAPHKHVEAGSKLLQRISDRDLNWEDIYSPSSSILALANGTDRIVPRKPTQLSVHRPFPSFFSK